MATKMKKRKYWLHYNYKKDNEGATKYGKMLSTKMKKRKLWLHYIQLYYNNKKENVGATKYEKILATKRESVGYNKR